MKKVLIFCILVLFLGSLLALESAPSDVVGFLNVNAPVGYNIFSNPFTYYDGTHTATLDLDDIVGTQLTAGTPANADRIIDANTGAYAFLMTGTPPTWTGTLTDFNLANAYYAKIFATPNNFYLAGSVEQDVMVYGTMNVGYNVVGLKEAGSVSLDDLDLISSGFTGGSPATSDRIIDANTGQFAFYLSGAWSGTLTSTTIGHSYYILVKNTAFAWTYDPVNNPPTDFFVPSSTPNKRNRTTTQTREKDFIKKINSEGARK
jgi:hypothetical protein